MDNRVHLPKLEGEELTKAGIAGWGMMELQVGDEYEKETRYPVFKCPFCDKCSSLSLHIIEPSGVINNSILCRCGRYHEWGLLDDWPSDSKKSAGKLTIEPSNL